MFGRKFSFRKKSKNSSNDEIKNNDVNPREPRHSIFRRRSKTSSKDEKISSDSITKPNPRATSNSSSFVPPSTRAVSLNGQQIIPPIIEGPPALDGQPTYYIPAHTASISGLTNSATGITPITYVCSTPIQTRNSSIQYNPNRGSWGYPSSVIGDFHFDPRRKSEAYEPRRRSNFLANQYDRDRRNIILSCFSKPNSKTFEAPNKYITHVRITEDPNYPNIRPPHDLGVEYRKNRIIIISTKPYDKKIVEVHKAKEIQSGVFRIGRTWKLAELTSIEKDVDSENRFICRLSKNYHWQTNSSRERTIFVKSLVNIYMQAFDGHVPELINWDLSTFYLDERTYQKALIKGGSDSNYSSTNSTIQPSKNSSPIMKKTTPLIIKKNSPRATPSIMHSVNESSNLKNPIPSAYIPNSNSSSSGSNYIKHLQDSESPTDTNQHDSLSSYSFLPSATTTTTNEAQINRSRIPSSIDPLLTNSVENTVLENDDGDDGDENDARNLDIPRYTAKVASQKEITGYRSLGLIDKTSKQKENDKKLDTFKEAIELEECKKKLATLKLMQKQEELEIARKTKQIEMMAKRKKQNDPKDKKSLEEEFIAQQKLRIQEKKFEEELKKYQEQINKKKLTNLKRIDRIKKKEANIEKDRKLAKLGKEKPQKHEETKLKEKKLTYNAQQERKKKEELLKQQIEIERLKLEKQNVIEKQLIEAEKRIELGNIKKANISPDIYYDVYEKPESLIGNEDFSNEEQSINNTDGMEYIPGGQSEERDALRDYRSVGTSDCDDEDETTEENYVSPTNTLPASSLGRSPSVQKRKSKSIDTNSIPLSHVNTAEYLLNGEVVESKKSFHNLRSIDNSISSTKNGRKYDEEIAEGDPYNKDNDYFSTSRRYGTNKEYLYDLKTDGKPCKLGDTRHPQSTAANDINMLMKQDLSPDPSISDVNEEVMNQLANDLNNNDKSSSVLLSRALFQQAKNEHSKSNTSMSTLKDLQATFRKKQSQRA
ncbi:hypothetical protein TBLA_0J01890 [Henningerozyma blattae CBS 6284]|uniref:Exocyst complex component Sec3 PIP2-binding N-terminal domain-containing protein n=1 Tax=Henningerozyma blattae (strain ATCC 34711 / CBS 6284 / DSM 70876 / NBRC 10599 / NRRL Y-10934 / UCD 77-7) TaxID=1071380 RepID=I2H9Y3_HENB6|nr:hypothetical protein TBLA_0J01890 [Tetrapisispora blattae CBS 6284]CCH63185.1 hypothetical protein TBLA_0J01890 [Tetrapisispora blattae CBS 6284]